uniref:Uncharacterized protein n=1 Tax=Chrysotila carterae TaxID=13221 RepID=A0A7S4BCW9_CHRCT|mmetsp:Transcript_6043/g.13216  ORF Transcript_6043/g.13216 Transcript_6043/m.13216 type:complete len:424 (+) Transcript_6043:129-1400(+)
MGGCLGRALRDHPEDVNEEWNECHACLSWVPFCGGWFIPTVSPEVTCLRIWSNENSMFKVFGVSYRIRHLLEHSLAVRKMGAIGLDCAERHRANLMLLAAFCSLAAWTCILIGAFGVSTDPRVIQTMPWARLTWTDEETAGVKFHTYFGINLYSVKLEGLARNGTDWTTQADATYEYSSQWGRNNTCDFFGSLTTAESTEELENFCKQCESSSLSTRTFVFMSIFTQLFQIATDLQRLTPFGDLNCQKLIGWTTSLLGLTTGLVAIFSWLAGCWRYFPESIQLASLWQGVNIETHAERSIGPGCALFMLAVLLKIVDTLLHIFLKTPEAKWAPVYTFIPFTSYCRRCAEKTVWGRPVSTKRLTSTTTELAKALAAMNNNASSNTLSSVSVKIHAPRSKFAREDDETEAPAVETRAVPSRVSTN